MSDLISRQAAIDAIDHICPVDTEYDCTLLDRVDVRYVLSDLPSAQPTFASDINVLNKDLISRQAVIDALDGIFNDVPMELTTEILRLRRELRGLPPADVVPVVRCKDCKFRDNDDFCTGRGFPCQLVPDDGFCDKGERKE